jgi:hypothetical protein
MPRGFTIAHHGQAELPMCVGVAGIMPQRFTEPGDSFF